MDQTVTVTIIKESSTHYSVRKLLIKNTANKRTQCICEVKVAPKQAYVALRGPGG
jgi:hypothetical protein